MKKFIFLLLGAMLLITPLETFAATNSSNEIITPMAYQETVISYTRQRERRPILIGGAWETLAYVETGYKNIQFTNGYRLEGKSVGYSDPWTEGLFQYRYKYLWYNYSTY